MKTKRILAFLVSLVMITALMPQISLAAEGAEVKELEEIGIEFISGDGFRQKGPQTAEKNEDDVTNYNVYVGGTRVTSANKDDLFGDGKASYDPETSTLTLNDPDIRGYIYNGDSTYKIASNNVDLTIEGSYHMTETSYTYGLMCINGSLTLNGDFTFLGTDTGVDVTKTNSMPDDVKYDLTLNGNMTLTGTERLGAANFVGDITFECGNFVVSGGHYALYAGSRNKLVTLNGDLQFLGGECGIFSNSSILVQSGNLYASGSRFGLYCREAGTSLTVQPSVESLGFDSSSTSTSDTALWVQSFIWPSEGDPKMVLTEPAQNIAWSAAGYFLDSNPYGEGPVIVIIEPDPAKHLRFLRLDYYDLWLGETQVTSLNRGNILGDNTASFDHKTQTLTLNNPTISGAKNNALIWASDMEVILAGRAVLTTDARYGVDVERAHLILDGDFDISSSLCAVYAGYGLRLGNKIEVLSPENAIISFECIYGYGGQPAKSVSVRYMERYGLWLGGTQVTNQNQSDILGDGKASYNPQTNTLTLNEPTITGSYTGGSGMTAAISAQDIDLTITGSWHMTSPVSECGVDLTGGILRFDGSFTIRGDHAGIYTNRAISVLGELKAVGTNIAGLLGDPSGGILLVNMSAGFAQRTRLDLEGGSYAMISTARLSPPAAIEVIEPENGSISDSGVFQTSVSLGQRHAVFELAGSAPGKGTQDEPFLIPTQTAWNALRMDLMRGYDSSGAYFLMTENIEVTRPLTPDEHPFKGVFDGGGHTLTLSMSADQAWYAPFKYISGATIRNLRTDGSLTGGWYCSGLVGRIVGGVNRIENCEVAVQITQYSSESSGILGDAGSYAAVLSGCVFSGSITGYINPNVTVTIIAYRGATLWGRCDEGCEPVIENCLDASSAYPVAAHGYAENPTITNTYYVYAGKHLNESSIPSWMDSIRLAHAVTAGENAAMTLDGTPGVAWKGKVYAAEGEEVSLKLSYTGTPADGMAFAGFAASSGDLVKNGDVWTLTMPGADVTITPVLLPTKPVFMRQSLTLEGKLGVNFYLDLPEIDGISYEDSYMEFSVGGKGAFTQQVPLDPGRKNTSGEYFGFTCYVSSVQMAETITAAFHYKQDGEDASVQMTYSVKQYLDYFGENTTMFDPETIALVDAIADYGYYAQIYLSNVNGWDLGEDYARMEGSYPSFTDQDYSDIKAASADFALRKSGTGTSNADVTYALSLKTDTSLILYVAPKDGYTMRGFTDEDGNTLDSVKTGGRYKLTIPNIPAHELGAMRQITVTLEDAEQNTSTITIRFCPLSYVYSVLKMSAEDTTFGKACGAWNAVCALYQYYDAAAKY